MRWDLFCRVIDNYGDIGVCWRLAADLGQRGHEVRLWVDDPAPLAWMAPRGAPGVQVLAWCEPVPDLAPGDAVVEAFGCDPPDAFVARMAAAAHSPAWINLEYLSAEPYVERSHGLPSPVMSGPGRGLVKRFFYPGFTPRTGGLLREPGLPARRAAFDRDDWLGRHGAPRRVDEQVVVLFCYPGPAALPRLLADLSARPTLLLTTPGAATQAVADADRAGALPQAVRTVALPWLAQTEFDHLLWAADLNFVRGEDSFVRAQWAGAPFVWQIYPQHDGVHADKLDAFLQRFAAAGGAEPSPSSFPEWAADLRALWRAWNGLGAWPTRWPHRADWQCACHAWCDTLAAQPDLATQLIGLVVESG